MCWKPFQSRLSGFILVTLISCQGHLFAAHFSPQSTFQTVLDDYLKMKDALVAENTWGTAMAASRIRMNLDHFLQGGEISKHSIVDQYIHLVVQPLIDQISGTGNIDIQRRYFSVVSEMMLKVVRMQGNLPVTLYYHHCPMANQNRGAYWVSKHPIIQNPYFGIGMLHCGKTVAKVDGLLNADPIDEDALVGKLEGSHVHGCHGPGQ